MRAGILGLLIILVIAVQNETKLFESSRRRRDGCGDAPVHPLCTKPRASPAKSRQPSSQGLFAPVVKGAKAVMGEKELNKLRGEVIAQHTKVISAFVDTSESKFGQIVLKRMFEAADKDGNGTLDKEVYFQGHF